MSIIIKPIISEKMTAQTEKSNRYGFIVDKFKHVDLIFGTHNITSLLDLLNTVIKIKPKGTKEVSTLEFDSEGHYLVATAKDEKDTVFIFDLQTKTEYDRKTTTDVVTEPKEYLLDTSSHESKDEFCVVGVNKIFFLNIKIKSISKNKYKKDPDEIKLLFILLLIAEMMI